MAQELQVRQDQSSAGRDIVAGNKTVITETHVHHSQEPRRSSVTIEGLMQKLRQEMEENQQVRHMVESLQYFHVRRSVDGIEGLEAKLKMGQRQNQLLFALAQKELFAKLLEKWSLYASAQEIFAYLLSRADHEYRMFIEPHLGVLSREEIDRSITNQIVDPLIEEVGAGVFNLNPTVVMGMFYWLAEQCFVRWHQ